MKMCAPPNKGIHDRMASLVFTWKPTHLIGREIGANLEQEMEFSGKGSISESCCSWCCGIYSMSPKVSERTSREISSSKRSSGHNYGPRWVVIIMQNFRRPPMKLNCIRSFIGILPGSLNSLSTPSKLRFRTRFL